jgi:hypothetical protein
MWLAFMAVVKRMNKCIIIIIIIIRSWDSSVSIVSDYRLDNLRSIPGRGKGFLF